MNTVKLYVYVYVYMDEVSKRRIKSSKQVGFNFSTTHFGA